MSCTRIWRSLDRENPDLNSRKLDFDPINSGFQSNFIINKKTTNWSQAKQLFIQRTEPCNSKQTQTTPTSTSRFSLPLEAKRATTTLSASRLPIASSNSRMLWPSSQLSRTLLSQSYRSCTRTRTGLTLLMRMTSNLVWIRSRSSARLKLSLLLLHTRSLPILILRRRRRDRSVRRKSHANNLEKCRWKKMELSYRLQEKVKMLARDHAASAGSQRTQEPKTALREERARLRESAPMALKDACHAISWKWSMRTWWRSAEKKNRRSWGKNSTKSWRKALKKKSKPNGKSSARRCLNSANTLPNGSQSTVRTGARMAFLRTPEAKRSPEPSFPTSKVMSPTPTSLLSSCTKWTLEALWIASKQPKKTAVMRPQPHKRCRENE